MSNYFFWLILFQFNILSPQVFVQSLFLFKKIEFPGTFKYVLDGIIQLMEGSGTINQDLYDSLIQCFEDTDPGLLDAVVSRTISK